MGVKGVREAIRIAGLAFAVLLTSCGGGGGGDGSGGSSLVVTADKSSVRLVGLLNASMLQETIHFTMRGGSGTYYGGVRADQGGIIQAQFIGTSDTTATVHLSPVVQAGTSTSGTITFVLCRDIACAQVAWSQTMPYTLNVFEISAPALTLVGYEGAASPATQLTITPPDTNGLLAVSAPTNISPAWLTASRSSSSAITVNTSAVGLPRGNYQSQVTVSFADIGVSIAQQTIPVSFTVGDGIVVPPARVLQLTHTATGASLAGTAPVAFQGTQAPTWSATSDQPWLVLSNSNGTGAGSLSYTVDTAQATNIGNWETGVAHVRVSAAGLSDASFQISLAKRLPEVLTATPNPMVAGRTNTLRVAGKGFSQLTNASQIRVGSTPGVTGVIHSDTEAVLTVPALPAGSTTVSITSASGLSTTEAQAAVVAPVALPYAVVPTTGEKRSAVFDPVRNALYTINITQNALQRFSYAGGQWQSTSLAIPAIGDLAFSPDRSTLYVSSGPVTLLAVNPDTLQVRSTHAYPTNDATLQPLAASWGSTRGMAVTNNLRLWFGRSQWSPAYHFDMRTAQFGSTDLLDDNTSSDLYSPQFHASGDGSKMLAVEYGISSPDNVLYTSSTDSGVLSTLPQIYGFAIFNEDGTKVLADSRVLYDTSSGAALGALQLSADSPMNAALSPAGNVGYVVAGTYGGTAQANRIEVFDLTRLRAGAAHSFEPLGQISLPDQAAVCGPSAPYGCNQNGSFVLSPLGNTLFWIGNQALVVIPVPAGMAQPAAAGLALRSAARQAAPPPVQQLPIR